jgi:hypothetical protein
LPAFQGFTYKTPTENNDQKNTDSHLIGDLMVYNNNQQNWLCEMMLQAKKRVHGQGKNSDQTNFFSNSSFMQMTPCSDVIAP